MNLYYCKTVDEFSEILTTSEVKAGSVLDSPPVDLGDPNVILERLRTSQGELEQILCDRFAIPLLRNSNAEFLRFAHAIIAWWHLEINGKGRELVRTKYTDLLRSLQSLTSIVALDGSVLTANFALAPGDKVIRTSKIVVGNRRKEALVNPFSDM